LSPSPRQKATARVATSLVPQITEGPGGGIVRHVDPRHVAETSWSRGRNIRFPTGHSTVRKTDGYLRFDTTPEAVRGLWYYLDPTEISPGQLVRIGTTAAWIGLTGAPSFPDLNVPAGLSQIVSWTPARTLLDVVTMCQWSESLIWADGLGVFIWNGTKGTPPIFPPAARARRSRAALRAVGDADNLLIPAAGTNVGMLADAAGGAIGEVAGTPTGKLVEIHKEHLLIGNISRSTTEGEDHGPQPWRVAYSVLGLVAEGSPSGTIPDFTGDGSGAVDFLEDSTPILALKVLGEHAIVHKAQKVYRMIYVGQPDQYHVEVVAANEGSIAANGPINLGSFQYYMGRTNFFRLGQFSEAIGDAIWPEVTDAVDWLRGNQVYAYRRLAHDEICWKLPARGAAQPNLTLVFNVRSQTWTVTDHDPGTAFAEVPNTLLPPLQFDPAAETGPRTTQASLLIPTSGMNVGLLRAGSYGGPPVREFFAQSNGDVHLYGGTNANEEPIHAWIESRHYQTELVPDKILAVPVFATGTGTLWVQLRSAMDARQPLPDWPAIPPSSARLLLDVPQTRPWIDVRGYGRLWQVRLESSALDDDWTVSAYGVAVVPGGFAR